MIKERVSSQCEREKESVRERKEEGGRKKKAWERRVLGSVSIHFSSKTPNTYPLPVLINL